MKLLTQLQMVHAAILFSLFFFLTSPILNAQQRSAADTIAFITQLLKDPVQRCDALYALGSYYFNIGDAENALLTMNQSKTEAEKHGYDKGIYDAYAIIGAIYLKQNDIEKVLYTVQQCLQLANKNKNEYGANRANYLLSLMYLTQGNLDSVISVCNRTIDANHVVYDSMTLPKIHVLLGNAYLGKGDLQQANKNYIRAYDIAELTNNEPLQSVCAGNLANINQELRNFQEAIKYQKKSIIMAEKNNHVDVLGGAFLSMGNSYKDMLVLDSAIYFFHKALTLSTQFGDQQQIAILHNNLGGTYIYLNQLDSGMYYLQLAKTELTTLNDTITMAWNALTMGMVWRKLATGENKSTYLQKALSELHFCEKVAEQKAIVDLKMKCYQELFIVYEAKGNIAQALDYLKKYSEINLVIRSEEYTKQIAEMQTKYETEKKELEITKLNASKLLDTEKISRQKTLNYSLMAIAILILISGFLIFRNVQHKRVAEKHVAILEKQNAIESMRNKIASDVHDEMGANLTRLGLNAQQLLQSPAVPGKEKQLAERISLQSKEIITGMREIIWASNPANDNLKSMLGFMRQYIDRFFDGTNIRPIVNFPHDVGEITLHPEVRRSLFFILKESLNNAIKYSGSNRIDIDFQNENESFNLHIKDYGKGIDDPNKDAFSNGLRNMKMRAELIQSLFKLSTAPGEGVEISIEGKLY